MFSKSPTKHGVQRVYDLYTSIHLYTHFVYSWLLVLGVLFCIVQPLWDDIANIFGDDRHRQQDRT